MNVRRAPWIAVGIAVTALAATAFPAEALEYSREAGWWTSVTAQFVHWTRWMAVLDVGAAVGLAFALERRSRALASSALAGGMLATALCVALLLPEGAAYRGASGLATALYAALAADMLFDARDSRARLLPLASLAVFATKTVWEFATGTAPVVGSMQGVRVAPEVHAAAAVGGALVAALVRAQGCRSRSADRDARTVSGCSAPRCAARISAQRT